MEGRLLSTKQKVSRSVRTKQTIVFAMIALLSFLSTIQSTLAASPTSAPTTATVDYSCLHAQAWWLNAKNDATNNFLFKGQTDILKSSGIGTTWTVTTNQIPGFKVNVTSNMVKALNARPTAWNDFGGYWSGNNGKTPLRPGQKIIFGGDVGYWQDLCGGFWPPGLANCPTPKFVTQSFPLKPAPETSSGLLLF